MLFSHYMHQDVDDDRTVYGHHICLVNPIMDEPRCIDINHVFVNLEGSKEKIYPFIITRSNPNKGTTIN